MEYPASELVLNAKGNVYHLDLHPDQLAETVILVGDQERVGLVSSFFDSIDFEVQHREFVTHTGTYRGNKISVVSTGIGTDNVDIVLNELDALKNIDLVNRIDKTFKTKLTMVRIGTCGILQTDVPVHSHIVSTHAYGLDNVAHFYALDFNEEEKELLQKINAHMDWPLTISPYLVEADSELVKQISGESSFQGITVTSSGFYGPQGRQLRIPLSKKHSNELLNTFEFNGRRILNFEMESSAIFALCKALGHACATVCLGVANRPAKEFSKGYDDKMLDLIGITLDRLVE